MFRQTEYQPGSQNTVKQPGDLILTSVDGPLLIVNEDLSTRPCARDEVVERTRRVLS